jgi:3',5'-cyclic AMP phosphodiesterase CpdA
MLIAQMSDLHAFNDAASVAAAERALSYLARLRPDVLIISGDLAEVPTEENYGLVEALLDRAPCAVFMIPGNADDRATMRRVFRGNAYWPKSGPMNFTVDLKGKIRLIGFDVIVEGESFGHATAEGLAWLDAALSRPPLLPILVMMHQHPFKIGIGPLDDAMCRNSEELAKVTAHHCDRIAAIVCGHGHRPVFTTLANTPAIMCPSLSTANLLMLDGYAEPEITDPPGFLVHHFNDGRLNTHVVSLG